MGRVYTLVIDRAQGCEIWNVDGNRFLDVTSGIAVLAAGHSHPRLVRAAQEQVARFTHMAGTDFSKARPRATRRSSASPWRSLPA